MPIIPRGEMTAAMNFSGYDKNMGLRKRPQGGELFLITLPFPFILFLTRYNLLF